MALDKYIYEKFRNAFEGKCWLLIIDAYYTSLIDKNIKLDWNENDISYELYEKMELNPQRASHYKIHLSPEFRLPKDVLKQKGFSDKLPRIDLKMSHFALRQEFNYFFEAKRLKEKSSELKRAYIDEGMDRYITEKYPLGCMLGYVLEGKIDKTINGINFLLKKDRRNNEILNVISNKRFKFTYQSHHLEIGTLSHLFFDFTEICI
ncbi:hypothetical protein [Sphingobacterium sp.]|uniref:hypothetical protein n=1 Tax=Sphingobacterium sp. TaxID=341027 RepID=UPI0028AA5540|nr:hypothetical protein [Sphingobacterium sp.]